MAFAAPALTMAGKTLLHKGLAGETIKFTRLKMGDGSLTTQNPAELTDLIHTVTEIDIETLNRKDNYVSIRGIFSNQSLSAGFYWREFGLFAQDPDKGEILYCYSNAGDLAEYITSADASEIVKKLTMSVAISDVQDIVLVADDSIVFATLDDLEALEQSVNASITNITQVIQQVTGTDISGGGEITVDGSMVVTLTHAKTGTVHAFTGLGDRTGLVPCQFKSTAGYTEGDIATIDGVNYTITLTGADAPETDLFVSGKSILVDVDTEGKTINFKSGGGLSNSKLALATATPDKVFNGYTYYGGDDKEIKTGTALAETTDVAAANLFNGKKAYDNNGNLITGTALATASTAAAADIVSGKTAYNNLGELIAGTRGTHDVQCGMLTPEALPVGSTVNLNYQGHTTAPKFAFMAFGFEAQNSISLEYSWNYGHYLYLGTFNGKNYIKLNSTYNFRNPNVSQGNSTANFFNTYVTITKAPDAGSTYSLTYVLVW